MFGDYLDGEWFLWCAVFALAYVHIVAEERAEEMSGLDEDQFDEFERVSRDRNDRPVVVTR